MDEEAIFTTALEIKSADLRAAFLDRACAGNAEMRRQVDELMGAHEQAGGFLDNAAAAWNARLPTEEHDSPAERPGAVLGPYKLLEQIGEGGMGLVFMADQIEPLRRRVAVKVIKPGMDSRQISARFEAERQALALMDHPNIAKVLDAGETSSGRPYFVMELVKGVPITEFCDQHRLNARKRLELFATVCQAVQHAHQKGIIHRDLKPSNVLVTLHDTVAVPKIIDFGIAKATTQPLTERTLFTNFAQMLGTPLYMSPEQAEMNGLDVDTRSDVYALGVLLYELLTGTTPFESETLKKVGLDEMRRMIREEEPPRPSHRVRTLGAEVCSTVSEGRSVDGRRLKQLLQGELDWIVMRALEKDRNRRYESASAFAADVQRYLNDETVAACPPSTGYRLRKFTWRNRRPLMTAGVLVVALVAATVVSAWQAVVARNALQQAEADRKQAEADRDRAKTAERKAKDSQVEAQTAERRAATEAAIATAVNNFVQADLIGQAASAPSPDRIFAADPHLTVKEALDRAAARIGQRFENQPLVEAAIQKTIGEAYISLFELQASVPHLERAVVLRKAHLDPGHPDTLDSMAALAKAYQWVSRHSEAIALRQRLLDNRRALLGPDHPETLGCMNTLAGAYSFAGQLDKSVRLREQLLEKHRNLYGPTHPTTLGNLIPLAYDYALMDRHTESVTLLEEFQALRKSPLGPELGVTNMTTIAAVWLWAGKLDKAEHLLRQALDHIRKQSDSVAQQNQMAGVLGYLAASLLLQQRLDEAEPFARQAVGIHQIEDPKRFYWVSVLGAVLLGQQKYAEAEPLLLKGYEGMKQQEALHPAVRRRMTEVAGWIVRFYEETDQPEKARAWREKVKPKPPDATSAGVK